MQQRNCVPGQCPGTAGLGLAAAACESEHAMDLTTTTKRAALGAMMAAALGCAATVEGNGGDGSVHGDAARDTGGDHPDIPYFDTNAYDVFRDDACGGNPAPVQRAYECDPVHDTGCTMPNTACYAYIEYPMVRCGSEVYRARCFPVGTTPNGAFCRSGLECGAGAGCFVTGAMNRCLQLCALDGTEPRCPRGTVCEPSDLPDFGACQ